MENLKPYIPIGENQDSQIGLVQKMLDPAFYPYKVTAPIELIQTHISYVLLTGRYAYKIKKAVDFGFLDFSTLGKRHFYCMEELRLNRRLCPGLYVDVVGIYRKQRSANREYGLVSLSDAGRKKVVEYAVRMRQFPQESLFSRRFEEGKLTDRELYELAELVAHFHQHAAGGAEIRNFGSVDAIRRISEDNYNATRPFIGTLQSQEQYERTTDFTRRYLSEHADFFAERQSEGKIRECHGDLHLNNICKYRNEIQVFDCIEFNPRLRNIDCIYEVAFLVMDLEFRKRKDLGYLFLNHYLEQTGDFRGAALLRFYCSLRATIRAKVDSLLQAENTVVPAARKAARRRGSEYYRLAASYADHREGRIYLMCGLSGSGKTTVARRLSQKAGAIYIRSDAVRKHLAGIPLNQHETSTGYKEGIYTPTMSSRTYSRMLQLGLFLASHGLSVILDAKYDLRRVRLHAMKKARQQGFPFEILYCAAPESVLRERIINRSDISDATADLVAIQRDAFESFGENEKPFIRTIHTHQDIDPQIVEIFRRAIRKVK